MSMEATLSVYQLTQRLAQLETEVREIKVALIKLRRDAREANGEPRYPHIIRTDNGLTVGGSRITLYDLMDYIVENYPPKYIRNIFNLSDEQVADALDYVEEYRAEVEGEYRLVLKQAEENQKYWEERNRERFAQIASMPPKPEYAEVYKKLREQREKYKA